MIENQQLCEVDGVQSTMGSERFGMLSSPSLTLSDMSTDTPRNPVEAGASPWFLPPVSPGNHRRTKSRAGHIGHRQNSLTESKVLLVTEAKRSHSVINPDLFQYHNHFEFLRLIGKTATSEVFCVRHRASGELFAVKRSRRRFRSKMQRERCLREVRAVAALPAHANIVSQYRAWQEGGHFHIQMDLCQGGTLLEALGQSHRMDDAALWRVAADVAAGLAFLHESGILHLDIKPENIYRDLGGAWRIGDFGLAVANESRDWEEGDGDFVAPELLNGAEPGPPADMFSLGASLYDCDTGTTLGGGGWGGHGAASELDFVDIAASSPQASTARPRASGAEDRDALSDRGSPWRGGPVEDGSSSMPVSPFECIEVQDGMYSPPVHPSRRQSGQGWPGEAYTCEARPAFFPAVPTPPPSSLAWDLYASPEFLMQLAPGSAAGSAPTHPRDKEVGQRTFSLRRFPTLDTIGALHLPEKPTDASESLASTREAGQDPRLQLASRRPLLHSLSCEVSPAAHQHTKQFASLPGTPA
ncbi:hypothetical protein APUTEX25_002764 [Auxenochlorella protothecoides]|uniref:Protein kinase domain-containing protein n=1 Tax=Auxenochlorella protothecoides TaxID=3075 RepID=A0A3M7L3S8_AUXPR|nr:hypothetical protein APUTEX25_002764 [Auxenochlorella protothecoides]|eukprot:RMZ56675.1 hypothetical protein APUTEX25_002764 [Auxenochlorella protothecoides]